ncbi:hypothetical protein K501DRAFT_270637 [Backusella circina FSU 941]|nr:hypothetical protein K501DRAFT_270637 [Backusella circina FSU 941]
MERTYIRESTSQNTDGITEVSRKSNRARKNKLKQRSSSVDDSMVSVQSDHFEPPSISIYNTTSMISLNKDQIDIKLKNMLIEPRQLANPGGQGTTAFIVEIVGISVAVIGTLLLIVACVMYPKRRKLKNLEKSMPLYENSMHQNHGDLHSRFEYDDSHTAYSSEYPRESTPTLSTHSFPTQLAPAVTHKKPYNADDISTNSRNKQSGNYTRNITNSVMMDTDNYTHSAMKLFNVSKPAAGPIAPILKNKNSDKVKKDQYRASLNTSIFGVNTPKALNRESTVDPYSTTDSVANDGQADSVFSGYEWTHQNGQVIPPKYHS